MDIAGLRDGRREPLSRPSTRHGKPVRTLTLGALRGVPAEGVGRDASASSAGESFPLLDTPMQKLMRMRPPTVGLSGLRQLPGSEVGKTERITMSSPRKPRGHAAKSSHSAQRQSVETRHPASRKIRLSAFSYADTTLLMSAISLMVQPRWVPTTAATAAAFLAAISSLSTSRM